MRNKPDDSANPPDASGQLLVALLATTATTASTLYGFHDVLSGARRDWEMVMHQRHVASPFRPLVVARERGPVHAPNDVVIEAQAGFADCPRPDVICITDLLIPPDETPDRFQPEADWVRAQYEAGATVTAACSGAVLLAHTGLLEGQDATSHWAFCEALRARHATTRWKPEQALVTSGVGQRLIMAGSGTNWHALALFLIARFVGAEEAMQASRLNLLDWTSTSPLAYAAFAHTSQSPDPVIARCQQWVAQHYQSDAPVAAMARVSGLAERTFQRRFAQATGLSPLDYVHTLRLEEAKQLLESGTLPVEMIALDVGYQDAGFFARLFKRKVGVTPAQYRRRFGTLARRLAGAAQTVQSA